MTAKRHFALFLLALLSVVDCLAKNAVAPMTAGNVFVKLGDADAVAPVKLTNWGDTEAFSITYVLYYMDTQQSDEPVTLTFDSPMADGEMREVNVPIKAGKKLGKSEVVFLITHVNGQYNETSVADTHITCCTVSKMPYKRVLVEDYAAMWCWHCPVGLVAFEAIARMFPQDVVPVSVHKADAISQVVSPWVYDGLIAQYASTLPAVWIARDTKAAGFDVTDSYKIEKSRVTCMNIDVQAQWDETDDNILVTTEVEPCMTPEEGSAYAVGYVLTASGLTNKDWLQEASYSEYASDLYKDAPQEMRFYADAVNYVEGYSKVKGVVYNHVAIESKGMQRGMENSLTGEYNANEVKRHTTTFDNISRYSVITDRSQIEIVAVLFNTQTGKIENAARCHVGKGGNGPSGIEQPTELAKPKCAGIYDMQGRKVTGKLLPGMYIVDGKKMMVK